MAKQPQREKVLELAGVRLVERAVADLLPAPYNPRSITDEALAGLGSSIEHFGLVEPVVLNERTGRIVGGHQRVRALQAAGVETVACVLVDLDEAREKALNVALNNPLISGDWTEDLGPLLREIIDLEPMLARELCLEELYELAPDPIAPIPELQGDPDDIPETVETRAKPGDLWLLGDHRLVCGDCTDAATVELALGGNKPRLMVTDPPYGVMLDMEWRDRAVYNPPSAPSCPSYMRKAGMLNDDRADWSDAFALVQSLEVVYVWYAASIHAAPVWSGLDRIGFKPRQQIIWVKPSLVMSRQNYHWRHEPCVYAFRDGKSGWRGSFDQTTVWEAASPKRVVGTRDEEKYDHPTQKPVLLYTRPYENHTDRGDCVYEPFSGSGTAIAAAEALGRKCIAIELDPKYVDVALARWEKLTGRTATLARP